MISPETQRLLGFLSDAASYPHRPSGVRMVQTHASWVFIAPPFVYKVKKPVDFGFLDFSTLARRKADCENEVRLNRRLADDIYLGVEAIRETRAGLAFGDDGEAVEWAVKMREMNPECFLSHRLRHGDVTAVTMDRVVERLWRFYSGQPPLPAAEAGSATARLHQGLRDNFDAARGFVGESLTAIALGAAERFSLAFGERNRDLLDSRIAGGWIRDCHGDLHTEHIHLTPEAVRIYDCIEFNDAFRHIDVASDIAFLAMDLDFNGRADLARHLVARFATLFDDDGLTRLMDFYKCYRAFIRGKVESLHAAGESVGASERAASRDLARQYFRLALRYAIAGSPPRAFVFMGRVASGKSALAEGLGRETGWPVVSSDRVRKSLAGVPLHHRGTPESRAELYSGEMTRRVYASLSGEAIRALEQGQNVIVDATFSRREHRDALRQLLERRDFGGTWVVVEASDHTTRERLREREIRVGGVVSDARPEDQATLGSRFEPPDELPATTTLRVSTDADPDTTLSGLLDGLALRNASRSAEPMEATPSRPIYARHH